LNWDPKTESIHLYGKQIARPRSPFNEKLVSWDKTLKANRFTDMLRIKKFYILGTYIIKQVMVCMYL
jgi:hypothetical protein